LDEMTTADKRGWKLHEEEQRMAWLQLTPAQRLAWLEEAKRFAEAARRARKIKPDDRRSQAKRA
jgi:predicted GIY-YIG superfamily endonuclease